LVEPRALTAAESSSLGHHAASSDETRSAPDIRGYFQQSPAWKKSVAEATGLLLVAPSARRAEAPQEAERVEKREALVEPRALTAAESSSLGHHAASSDETRSAPDIRGYFQQSPEWKKSVAEAFLIPRSGGLLDEGSADAIALVSGTPSSSDSDRLIILVSAGATEPDAVVEPAIGLADVPMIALADEPAAASPPRDRSPTGSRLRPRDSGIERRDAARRDPCGESLKACKDALQFLRDDDIASIDLDIRVGGTPGNDYPCECRLEGETFQPRRFASTTMTWKAAGYCHKPLYFEDWELERYGHSRGMFLDPFIAGAHFFVTLPILPYKAGMQAPWECVYPLGYYRPGSCAPWTVPGVPYSPRGFAVQAATVTGLVFLLP